MAARKAAPKRGASRYQAPAKQPVPGWIWLVCGLVIGGFIMFLMSLEPGGEEVKRAKEAPKTAVKEQPKRTPATEQPPKPKYDFYTLLPESEVILPPGISSPSRRARRSHRKKRRRSTGSRPGRAQWSGATAATDRGQGAGDAVLPAGRLVPPTGGGRPGTRTDHPAWPGCAGGSVKVRDEPWYRVLVGPFGSREQLNAAQKTLAASGYKNLLLQQRQAR